MRQAGFLAAAGIYALDHQFERLAEDHKKAKELETILNKLDYIKKVEPVETNIIIFELNEKYTDADFNAKMSQHQIRLSDMGQGKKRIVTHHDYTDVMHDKFCEVLVRF